MGLRILVVDDSEPTRRMIRSVLETRDWKICGEAENGLAALTEFQALRPDVVVLDLAMPQMNGIEAARCMSGVNPRVPLILFTLTETEGLQAIARRAGVFATVSKDHAMELLVTIDHAIAERAKIPRNLDGPVMSSYASTKSALQRFEDIESQGPGIHSNGLSVSSKGIRKCRAGSSIEM